MSLAKKINRYTTLVRKFKNWPAFLAFKSGNKDSFLFEMRNGFKVSVSKKMLPPFKESFFDDVYLKHFPKGGMSQEPLIVDIGANVGFFSLAMFAQFPKARIIAFEPMPFNFGQLSLYQKAYPNFKWVIENKAIADHNDGLTLYSATIDGFSTMAGVFASDGRGQKIEVDTLTLEQVMKDKEIVQIDLLKLDCEGSEYAILYSLSDDYFDRIKRLSIESHPGSGIKQNHQSLVSYLKSKSFQIKDKMNFDGTGYIWAWKEVTGA